MVEQVFLHNPVTPRDLQATKEWDHAMRRIYNAQRISDPKLLEITENYAKQLGIKTPLLYVAEEFPAIFGGKMPNAAAHPLPTRDVASAIAFTRAQFTCHNYHLHGAQPPNEVLWMLGHEMGHLKQGGSYLQGVRKYPWMVGAAAAVAGMVLLEKAINRAKETQKDEAISDEKLQATLASVSEEERAKIKILTRQAADSHVLHGPLGVIESMANNTISAGEYAAAAATGALGGKFATRQFMLNAEYHADAVGARLSGDPRAGIRSLQASKDYIKNMPRNELKALRSRVKPADIFSAIFDNAHPTNAERFARLEKMAVDMERNAGKMSQNAKVGLGAMLERATPLLSKLSESLHGIRVH